MSHKITIDLDESADSIRENLDLVLPHVTNQAQVNPKSALKVVTAQWATADLILSNLEDKYVLEIERFETLRREARGLIKLFWENYQLFPIQRANGQVVQAQVVEPHAIKHVGENRLNGKQGVRPGRPVGRKARANLTPEQRYEVWKYANDNKPLTDDDYALLLETYNISRGGVNHIMYEYKPQ